MTVAGTRSGTTGGRTVPRNHTVLIHALRNSGILISLRDLLSAVDNPAIRSRSLSKLRVKRKQLQTSSPANR